MLHALILLAVGVIAVGVTRWVVSGRDGGGRVTVRSPRLTLFGWFAFLFFLASQATAFLTSPPDRDMGDLQKIIYVHVPSAWMSLVGYTAVFVLGLLYLRKRDLRYDLAAAACAEIGAVCAALTLASGSIFGRPTWGIWWTWDARLTSMAVLLIMYVSYLALRALTDDEVRRARWSAAIAGLGFLNSYIVYMSVRWWRTLHQLQSTPETFGSKAYTIGLELNAFAFLFLFIYFAVARYRTSLAVREADAAAEERALAPATGGVHV